MPLVPSDVLSSLLLGTDEAAIIEILSSRTSDERQQIKQKYKTKYGKVTAGLAVLDPGLPRQGGIWRAQEGNRNNRLKHLINFRKVEIALVI